MAASGADLPDVEINKVDAVITETFSEKGNFTSEYTLSSDEVLDAGAKFLGQSYKELGKAGSGVFRSSDGTRQFRIDNNSLDGRHEATVPHAHLETFKADSSRKAAANNHIILKD